MRDLRMIQNTLLAAATSEKNRISLHCDDIAAGRVEGYDLTEWRAKLDNYREAVLFAQELRISDLNLIPLELKKITDRFAAYQIKAAAKIKEDPANLPKAIKAFQSLQAELKKLQADIILFDSIGVKTIKRETTWDLENDIRFEIACLED